MARDVVELTGQGRVTLPARVRRELRLSEGSRLQVEVEDGAVRLRPLEEIPADDAWLYTKENLEGIRRGLEDIKAGRVYELGRNDLEAMRFPRRARPRK